jgi:uncharacterized membrane protein YsdA (DUF1294 family)
MAVTLAWFLVTLAWRVIVLRLFEINSRKGVHKFSRNLEATLKFQAPEGGYLASSIQRTHKYYAPPQKFARAIWPPGFVHP